MHVVLRILWVEASCEPSTFGTCRRCESSSRMLQERHCLLATSRCCSQLGPPFQQCLFFRVHYLVFDGRFSKCVLAKGWLTDLEPRFCVQQAFRRILCRRKSTEKAFRLFWVLRVAIIKAKRRGYTRWVYPLLLGPTLKMKPV